MPTPLRVLVGALGPGRAADRRDASRRPPGTVLLDLGPEHPSGTGLVELRLWVEDGVVTEASVVVGALHRGVEKLFEVRDYRQILMLADRHDWQAPFAAELTVALTCEQLLGLEVPAAGRLAAHPARRAHPAAQPPAASWPGCRSGWACPPPPPRCARRSGSSCSA